MENENEANLEGLGNYESDSSDIDLEDQLQNSKEQQIMSQNKQLWGFSKKENLYGRNKASDDESDSDDDQDELQ